MSGMGQITGLDMPAVFAMADALGVDRRTMALFMGDAEQGIMRGLRKRSGGGEVLGDH